MEQIWAWIVRATGAAGALIAGLLGGWDGTMKVLCFVMALDFVTGLLVAYHGLSGKTEGGGLSSRVSFLGLTKKVLVLMLVGLAVGLDEALGTPGVLRLAVSMFYIANEALSVTENAALLGVPMPPALKKALEAMRERDEGMPGDR